MAEGKYIRVGDEFIEIVRSGVPTYCSSCYMRKFKECRISVPYYDKDLNFTGYGTTDYVCNSQGHFKEADQLYIDIMRSKKGI